MDGDKVNAQEPDTTELSESGKYNHLPEETATSNMVSPKEEEDGKMSPEGGKLLADEDAGVTTEVKFISPSVDSHNGDANISIEAVKIAFTGMGKEELMKYANDPFWIRLRWALFGLFWLLWAAMLAIAIGIIVMAPKCAAPAPKTWWEESPIYQIQVPSFKDGSASQNGKGDLKGIKEKVDYFTDLGIQGIALSNVMKVYGSNSGNIENFIDIDPELGTLEDFESLASELKEKGVHVALQFIPNHSSLKHDWFNKSVKRIDPYTDYYVWAESKGHDPDSNLPLPPNNWLSWNGGSAWTFNSERNAFYLHQFGSDQPDLNFHNKDVIQEFKEIFKFWIEKGASGFILENVDFLLEDPDLANETMKSDSKTTHDDYDFYNHFQTRNYAGTSELISVFKEHVKNLTDSGMLAIKNDLEGGSSMQYYDDDKMASDLSFGTGVTKILNAKIDATTVMNYIESVPNGTWPSWQIGNAKLPRLASRVPSDMVDGVHMTFMLLPGTPLVFFGDELGMEGIADLAMPWSNSTNGGFSESPDSLAKVSESYALHNVERQQSLPESHYKVFKTLLEARKSPSIMFGSRQVHVLNSTVLAYNRVKSGSPGYLVLFNMGSKDMTVDLSPFANVPQDLTVLIRSVGFKDESIQVKTKLTSDAVSVPSHDSLVLTYVPSDKME